MDDNGTPIDVDIEFAELQGDLELGGNDRFLLGYVSLAYESDVDFSLKVYFKRDKSMVWESTDTYTIDKDVKGFFTPLPPHLNVIDAYPRVWGTLETFKITSCKLFVKPQKLGKFGKGA
jgi:hypothetical protein